MLDVQRSRSLKHREEIDFTRRLMWVHVILGGVVITLFLLQAFFTWFAGAMVWYALSLVLMYGCMNERPYCRWLLALVFLVGTAAGLYLVNRVYPASTPPRAALMPLACLPIWAGFANLIYGIGVMFLLFDARIRRAGEVSFTLW